jgi:hypothetical protein
MESDKMLIRKIKVLNVAAYLEGIPEGAAFRPVVELDDGLLARLGLLGFPEPPSDGDSVLPMPCGPVSRFNAEGRWQVHRDKPKERRYIRTVSWRWKQWAGRGSTEEREEFRDIHRDCYPRTLIAPPGVELTFVERDGRKLLVGPTLKKGGTRLEAIGHAINLMLEIGGVCELLRDDLSRFAPVQTRHVRWRMLPPGEHPWDHLRAHLTTVLRRFSPNTQRVIFDRQETIVGHAPDEQYIGLGGFDDYIAYVFRSRGIVVLESIRRGNAIYVFGDGWRRFSQLSKAEVLDDRLHLARIVHAGEWKKRLARFLDGRAAA